jgi:hypothetical protein
MSTTPNNAPCLVVSCGPIIFMSGGAVITIASSPIGGVTRNALRAEQEWLVGQNEFNDCRSARKRNPL